MAAQQHSKKQPVRGETLTSAEHTAIGALAGMIEVCTFQPTVGVKNALQEGRPVPTSPRLLYRGLVVNAGSMAPITAVQFGANRALENIMVKATGHKQTQAAQLVVAAGAGGASSLFSCPAELIMIQQQKTGRSLMTEAVSIFQRHGALRYYRGWRPTVFRESVYTAGYLGVCPVLRESLEARGWSPGQAFAAGGVTAGMLASVLTHPADTIKTRMQASLEPGLRPEYATALSTLRYILDKEGVAGVFSGMVARSTRIIGATFLLNIVRNKLIDLAETAKARVQ